MSNITAYHKGKLVYNGDDEEEAIAAIQKAALVPVTRREVLDNGVSAETFRGEDGQIRMIFSAHEYVTSTKLGETGTRTVFSINSEGIRKLSELCNYIGRNV